MAFSRLGVWYSTDRLSPSAQIDLAKRAEALGYSHLWYPESTVYESMSIGAHLLCHTTTLNVGSSIASIYARDPVTARNGLRTLDAISGGRFVLGLGVSHRPLVEGLRGHQYGRPVAAMRAYLDALAARDDAATRNSLPVVIAALGPKMLALAAELTRGAIPYNVTPEHTAAARTALGEGKWLAVEQKVCFTRDAAVARARAKAELERYMALPNYRNNWLRLGFTEAELADGGNDRFLDAMVAWGALPDIETRIRAHLEAGADQVVVQPVDPGGDRSKVDYDLLEALAPINLAQTP